MTQSSFPFAAGPGSSINAAQWQLMARLWLSTGVVQGQMNGMAVVGDSTGMQVKVNSGVAWIQGFYYQDDQLEVVPVPPSSPANPRIDRIILRLDLAGNTISLLLKQGVAQVGPTPPALTQTTGGIWEISLAQVLVGAGVSTIAAGNVTDERPFATAPGIGSQQATFSYESTVTRSTSSQVIITRPNHTTDYQGLTFMNGVGEDAVLFRNPADDNLMVGFDNGQQLFTLYEFGANGHFGVGAFAAGEFLHVKGGGVGGQFAIESGNSPGNIWGLTAGDSGLLGTNQAAIYRYRAGSVAGMGGGASEAMILFSDDGTTRITYFTNPAGIGIFCYRNDANPADPGCGYMRSTGSSVVLNASGANGGGIVYLAWDVKMPTYLGGQIVVTSGNGARSSIAGGLDVTGTLTGNSTIAASGALLGHGSYSAVETGNGNTLHAEVAIGASGSVAGNAPLTVGITFARAYGSNPVVSGGPGHTTAGNAWNVRVGGGSVSTTSATLDFTNQDGNTQTLSDCNVMALGA